MNVVTGLAIFAFTTASGYSIDQTCPISSTVYHVGGVLYTKATDCLHSKGNHDVYPKSMMVNLSHMIDWNDRDKSFDAIIKKCADLALERWIFNFAIENHGECYVGILANTTQGYVTQSDGCEKCKVGKHSIGGPGIAVLFDVFI